MIGPLECILYVIYMLRSCLYLYRGLFIRLCAIISEALTDTVGSGASSGRELPQDDPIRRPLRAVSV